MDDQLKEGIITMLKAGGTLAEIRAALHVSTTTIQRVREEAGIPAPKPGPKSLPIPQEELEEGVRDMLRKGKSIRDIAAKYRIGYERITIIRDEADIVVERRPKVHVPPGWRDTMAHFVGCGVCQTKSSGMRPWQPPNAPQPLCQVCTRCANIIKLVDWSRDDTIMQNLAKAFRNYPTEQPTAEMLWHKATGMQVFAFKNGQLVIPSDTHPSGWADVQKYECTDTCPE